jgi:hypothetical protein
LCNINKSRACTSKIAGVVAIGVAKYDSLNRVATTATGVIFTCRNGYWINSKIRIKNTAKFIENGVSGGDNRSTGVTGSSMYF